MTQYSANNRDWNFSTKELLRGNLDRVAKSLGVIPGGWIWYREHDGDVVRKLQYKARGGR